MISKAHPPRVEGKRSFQSSAVDNGPGPIYGSGQIAVHPVLPPMIFPVGSFLKDTLPDNILSIASAQQCENVSKIGGRGIRPGIVRAADLEVCSPVLRT